MFPELFFYSQPPLQLFQPLHPNTFEHTNIHKIFELCLTTPNSNFTDEFLKHDELIQSISTIQNINVLVAILGSSKIYNLLKETFTNKESQCHIIAGNHDLSKNKDKTSSFEILAKLFESTFEKIPVNFYLKSDLFSLERLFQTFHFYHKSIFSFHLLQKYVLLNFYFEYYIFHE